MTVDNANKEKTDHSVTANGCLSKSKKKRMRQKAAKTRKEAKEAPAMATNDTVNKKSLNSYENLREDLKQLGYSYSEIDKTLEDMWNLKLQYDELDSVLAFIRSRAIQKDMEINNPLSASTSSASSSHVLATNSEIQVPPQSLSVNSTDQIETADDMLSVEDKVETTKIKRQKEQKEVVPMSLKERLSMVADFESLPDAIVALTEWVAKAAISTEIEEMCNKTSDSALYIVTKRSIVDPSPDISLLLKLIGTILKSTGLPPSDINASVDHLAKLLNLACMTVKETNSGIGNHLSTMVSNLIVKTISQSLKEIQCSTQNGVDKIQQIEKDIECLASSLAGNGAPKPQVVKLMTKRDTHKKAAEKYSTVMSITLISSALGSDHAQPNRLMTTSLDDETIRQKLINDLTGNDPEMVISNKIKFESLKRQLAKANSSSFAQRDALNAERESSEKRRHDISERIQELRLEIQKLEQEDEMIKNKIVGINGHISSLVGSQSAELCELENELGKCSKVIKLDENAKSLVQKLHGFESIITKATTSTYSNGSCTTIFKPDQVSRKMGIYIVRMMNYFNSEADMVIFLKNRVKELEKKIPGLQFEIEECVSLGMTTNVSQMKKTLNETRQNIVEDNELISALQGDAEKMKDDLMKLLHNFENGKSNKTFMSLQASMLNGIKEALVKIGLDNDGGLGAYFHEIASSNTRKNGEDSKDKESDKVQKQKLSEHKTIETPQQSTQIGECIHSEQENSTETISKQTRKPQSTVTTVKAPLPKKIVAPKTKMRWAVNTTSAPVVAKSFLDIQKEELKMKEVQ